MLIEFSVENYLSFKELATFSMLTATSVKEHQEHAFKYRNRELLKTAAIYGPNGSGKSNLIKAMKFMKEFIRTSSKESQVGEEINVERFRLSSETDNEPCFFEIIFVHNNIKYRYGFTVDTARVHEEWLYQTEKTKEAELFFRSNNGLKIGAKFREAEVLKQIIRENALFLSVAAQFNIKTAVQILEWFGKNFIVITTDTFLSNLAPMLESKFKNSDTNKGIINHFIRIADLGIDDIQIKRVKFPEMLLSPSMDDDFRKLLLEGEELRVSTVHNKYDSDNNIVAKEIFDLERQESDGTKKLLGLSTHIIDALAYDRVLIIDEIDARLHSHITRHIVDLFNSHKSVTKTPQLIFTTHDINLLDKDILRRDQIWFTEKDIYGATTLYSLVEFKVRNDSSFKKNYLSGRFGAIPFLGDFNSIVESSNESK